MPLNDLNAVILIVLFYANVAYGANTNQQIRIALITDNNAPFSHSSACVHVTVPFGGTIYCGLTPTGGSESVIVNPLFVTSDNGTLIDFTFSHSCYGSLPHGYHTLHITNSAGYDRYVQVTSSYHFNDIVPLNPSGDTVISIIFMY